MAANSARGSERAAGCRLPFFRDESAPGLRTCDFDIRLLHFRRAPEARVNMKSRRNFVKRRNDNYISGVM
jgi:hypothetical protein